MSFSYVMRKRTKAFEDASFTHEAVAHLLVDLYVKLLI